MVQSLFHRVECEPTCGFSIRSHDDAELTQFVIEHNRHAHQKNLTASDVRRLWRAA